MHDCCSSLEVHVVLLPDICLSGPNLGPFFWLALLEQLLLNDVDDSSVLTNLLPLVGFAVNSFVDGVVSVFDNEDVSKINLDLAGIISDVRPYILLFPVNFTVLL